MVKNDKSSQSSQRKEGGNSLAMFARDKTNSRRFLFGSKAADQEDEKQKEPIKSRKETELVKEEEEKENCGVEKAVPAKAPILIILDDLEKLENNKNETSGVSGGRKSCSPVLNMPTSGTKKPFEATNSSKKPVANSKSSNKLANDPTPKITNFLLAKYQHTSVNQFKLTK